MRFLNLVKNFLQLLTRRTNRMGSGSTAGAMRRALVIVVCFFLSASAYLYWNQVRDYPAIAGQHVANDQSTPVLPVWTWICVNNHCEKRECQAKSGSKHQQSAFVMSLATCSMLCGSTQLWPQPTGPVNLATHSFSFTVDQLVLNATAPKKTEGYLQKAFNIFKTNVQSIAHQKSRASSEPDFRKFIVHITIESPSLDLKLSTDESYNLTLRPVNLDMLANIKAHSFFGARHGLETLSQFAWWDDESDTLRILKAASVQDAPKFAYRGLMIDTSRNFFSIASLKRAIDGMAASKLNVFHWHITDSQSFPFDPPSEPEMAKTGAYRPDQIYTAADIEEFVAYSKIRGIRVMIEIDTPAHAGMGWTWGPSKGLGNLAVCVGQQPWSLYCGEPPCGQLNPENPNVYNVLEHIYEDILKLTGEREIFHLGGDEVNLECWAQQRTGTTSSYNYTDLHDLWGNFTLQALKSLERANSNTVPSIVVIWSSNLTKKPYLLKYLDNRIFVVQTWGASQWMETYNLLESDYRIIISHVDAWYLDCGFGKWRESGEAACDPYRTWQTMYSHRPWHRMRLSSAKKALIIGGEACLWSEQVSEGALDGRLWPRAAAVAERLWSDIATSGEYSDSSDYIKIPEDTYTRFNTHRERLIRRGIKAEAIWPKWCTQNPGMCL